MIVSALQVITGILMTLFGFMLLIVVHELGHFLIAKRLGVWAEEFGIGLPPRLWGKKIGETIYSINAFPIGGFVRMHGEVSGDEISKPKRAFINQKKRAKAIIALGGVLANFLLAIFIFSITYSITGIPKVRETGEVRIVEIAENSPAETAGLAVFDKIVSVDGEEVTTNEQFIQLTSENEGKRLRIKVERKKEEETYTRTFSVTPEKFNPELDRALIGVTITSTEAYTHYPPLLARPFVGAYNGIVDTITITKAIFLSLGGVATSVSQGQVPDGVVAPTGIVAVIYYFAQLGVLPFMNLIAMISINLAVLNLIPFPPLDGSRILFLGVEAVMGKRYRPKVESAIHTIGMIILLLLILLMAIREVPQIISQGLTPYVESLIPVQ